MNSRLLALLVSLATPEAKSHDHIVIVDAGSSGTRAHAFKYKQRIFSAKEFPIITSGPMSVPEEIGSWGSHPGLSSFVADPDSVGSSLQPLLEFAAAAIRKDDNKTEDASLADVPVYLGATAGMRLLNDEHRDKVMAGVRRFFNSSANPFKFTRSEQARVLAGEEEGAFGWIAANQRLGKLSSDPKVAYGALDMGGASTQISFLPYETSVLANMFPMHIGRFAHGPVHLYTHSFLKFGYHEAFRNSALLASIGQDSFDHPCLPPGLEWFVDEGVFGIGAGAQRKHGQVKMRGSGNFWMCQTVARSLMVQGFCSVEPCTILGVYRPPLDKTLFLAFSEFKQNFNRMGITNETVAPPLEALQARLATWCSMTVDEQAAVHNETIGGNGKIELSCFLGVWILELLTTGFGFPIDTRNIEVRHMENAIGWAQGQAIYETSFFPYVVNDANLMDSPKEWAKDATPKYHMLVAWDNSGLQLAGRPATEVMGWLSPFFSAAFLVIGVSWGRRDERRRVESEHPLLG